MCSVTALAVGSLVMAGTSTAVGVAGAIQQSKGLQAQADYQADVARENAKVAESLAQDAEHRGKETELDFRERIAATIRRQRAGLAAKGVLVDSDSAGDLVVNTATLGEADVQTIRADTAMEAFGFRHQGTQFLQSAELARLRSKSAKRAGIFGAATSLTDGTGRILGSAARFKKEGIFGG